MKRLRPPRLSAPLIAVIVAALVTACGTPQALREGRALIAAGQYETGVTKLRQASDDEPGNASYRVEYLNQRDGIFNRLLQAGDAARAAGRLDEAEENYRRALAIGGEGTPARAGLDAVARDRRHGEMLQQAQARSKKGDREGAAALVRTVLVENPRSRGAQNLQRQLDEELQKEGLATPTLRPRLSKPVTLQFREAPVRQVFDALSRTTGINFVFDREVRADLRATIYVRDVAVEDAIDLILLPNQLEKKVLAETSVLIYPNTAAKLREYQDLVIKTFYLANTDVKQTVNMIKTLLKTKDIHVDEKLNLLVMRDTPEAIRLAEKLVAAQDLAEPEVVLEVAVLEITRSRLTELGIKWPDTINLSVIDPSGTPPLLLSELRDLSSDRISVSPTPSVTINARSSRGDSNLLANPRIRVKNRDKARILVGDRLPVISAIVTPSTGTPVTTENVTYIDVGLKLEVEPTVFLDDDVAIKVGLEVSTASNRRTTQNGTTVYDIGTRSANTTLRLKNGETQVLMGLIRDDDRRTASGVPGLSELPLVGRLFASHLNDAQKTEVVLSITPRVVRNVERAEVAASEFWSGTEATLRAQPLLLRPVQRVGDAAAAADVRAEAAPTSADMRLAWVGPQSARVGTELEFELHATLQQPLTGASLQFGFDAKAIEIIGVAEGELLKAGKGRTMLSHKVDPVRGKVLVSIVRAGESIRGDGALLKVRARPRTAVERAQLQVTLASPVGLGGQPMSAAPTPPLTFSIGAAP